MKQLLAVGTTLVVFLFVGSVSASAKDMRIMAGTNPAFMIIQSIQPLMQPHHFASPRQYRPRYPRKKMYRRVQHGYDKPRYGYGYGKPPGYGGGYGKPPGYGGGYGKPPGYGSGGYGKPGHGYGHSLKRYLPPKKPKMTCLGGFPYKDMRDGRVRCWPDSAPTPPPGKPIHY